MINLPPDDPEHVLPSHRKIGGFEEVLREMSINLQNSIKCFCNIGFPYRVETRIVHQRNSTDTTRVMEVGVELKDLDDDYVLTEHKYESTSM